jgi:hypothetical protein
MPWSVRFSHALPVQSERRPVSDSPGVLARRSKLRALLSLSLSLSLPARRRFSTKIPRGRQLETTAARLWQRFVGRAQVSSQVMVPRRYLPPQDLLQKFRVHDNYCAL